MQPLQETRHNKKAPKGRRKNDVGHWLDGATHPGFRFHSPLRYLNGWCDTPRPSATPLREGMARQRYTDNKIDNQNDAAAHPLSERGGRRPGCVASSSIDNPGCVALSNIDNPGCVAPSNIDNPGCVALSNIDNPGCVAPLSIYNPGVSHHQAKALIYSVAPTVFGGFARLTIGNDIGHR